VSNQIMNILNIKGGGGRVQEVLDFVKGDAARPGQIFDLNRIVPMPAPVRRAAEAAELGVLVQKCLPTQWAAVQEVVAEAHFDYLTETGYATADAWMLEAWGTIRNVYSCKYNRHFPSEIVFCSVDAPPLPALASLSQLFPDVVLEIYYECHDLSFSGWALFADGDGCEMKREWDSYEEGGADAF
jgi:hypothetical protein